MGVVDTFVATSYQLSSVIMHHGTGFQSGHYTAYCWNTDAGACDVVRRKNI